MNFLEMIQNNLKGKNLTDLEILRYIYLMDCQFFSFDERWDYAALFDDYEFKRELELKEINLENVTDSRVLCRSNSIFITKYLTQQFTSLNCYVILSFGHYYLRVMHNGNAIDLDPTKTDFTRMKIKLRPDSFLLHDKTDDEKKQILKELDDSLGYGFLTKKELVGDVKKQSVSENLHRFADLINKSNFVNYYDASSVMTMFTIFDKVSYDTYLNKDYEFHKLILDYPDGVFYEILKVGDYYKAVPIDKDRIEEVTHNPSYKNRWRGRKR